METIAPGSGFAQPRPSACQSEKIRSSRIFTLARALRFGYAAEVAWNIAPPLVEAAYAQRLYPRRLLRRPQPLAAR